MKKLASDLPIQSNLNNFNDFIMLKILQIRLQHYVNHEIPDVQAEPEIKLPTSVGSSKKQESSGLCGSQQMVENSEIDGNTKPPNLTPEKSVCR